MRFLVLSDIHGATEKLEKLDDEFGRADAVLFAGDFARLKDPSSALGVLNTLIEKHDSLF